jgi:hypothetical protein
MLSMSTIMLLIATKVTNFQTSKSDLHAQFQDSMWLCCHSYLIRSNISPIEETKNNVRFSVVRHATTLIPRYGKQCRRKN